jgi:hypothetical protein
VLYSQVGNIVVAIPYSGLRDPRKRFFENIGRMWVRPADDQISE